MSRISHEKYLIVSARYFSWLIPVLQMILQNRRLRHFKFCRNILEPLLLRIFDWIFRILQYENKYSRKGDGMMKNRKTALLGMIMASVLMVMTACGQDNMDNQNNSGKDNMVNDVTNGTDRNNNTDRNDTLGDDMENLGDDVRDGANDTVDGIQEGADDVIDGVQKGANDVVDGVQNGMDAGENNHENTNTKNEKTDGTENQKNQ